MKDVRVLKRDGNSVEYNSDKIRVALNSANNECGSQLSSDDINSIVSNVEAKIKDSVIDYTITVEGIQNIVEGYLMSHGAYSEIAKIYMIYRYDRANERKNKELNPMVVEGQLLTDKFISKYKHVKPPMTNLGLFVYYRTYSRWLPEERRREYWYETVRRAVEYNCGLVEGTSKSEAEKLFDNVFNLKQFVSSRTLWTGGTEASTRNGMSNFNCSFTCIDRLDAFSDIFHILMVGSGAGFRVLPRDVEKLPKFRQNVGTVL